MNCDDYLSMLATLPAEELAYGRAREHAAECRDCNRVTRVVMERERNLLMAYGGVHSSVPATQTASNAMLAARRSKASMFYKIAVGVVTAGLLLYFVAARSVIRAPAPERLSETFHLQCLSPEQAGEMLRPHIKQTGQISMRAGSPLGVLTVSASAEEMERARALLSKYDNPAEAQCAVQVKVPPVR